MQYASYRKKDVSQIDLSKYGSKCHRAHLVALVMSAKGAYTDQWRDKKKRNWYSVMHCIYMFILYVYIIYLFIYLYLYSAKNSPNLIST